VLTLTSEQYAPITSSFGFLEAPLVEVAAALESWTSTVRPSVVVTPLDQPFPDVLAVLEPLVAGTRPRELLVEHRPGWTAYFDCGLRGTDAVSAVAYLSRTMGCQGLAVRCTPHIVSASAAGATRMGAVQFELFGPLRTDFINYVRTVACTFDGSRWRFDVAGTEQVFEETDAYALRRVRDRFTSHALERYCRALGIDPFRVEAYGPGSVLVESAVGPVVGGRVMTLAEVQEWLSIVPGAADALRG
jgi:hypothetical protein